MRSLAKRLVSPDLVCPDHYAGPDWILTDGPAVADLSLLPDGSLCVAHASLGAVFVFAPSSEPLWRVVSCAGDTITNIALAGADQRTLYMTESTTGSILRATLPSARAE